MQVTPIEYLGLAFLPKTTQVTYCSGKLNSAGCVPSITGTGFPSPSLSYGYTVSATDVRNQSVGTMAFGLNGPATIPFHGGTLCLAQPWRRTLVQSSGGNSAPFVDCSGAWQLDLNTWFSSTLLLPPSTVVQCQWIGRDPGFAAPLNWTLSNALEFVVRY
jgi:hypothetical protein